MIKWGIWWAGGSAHDNFGTLDVVVNAPGGFVWQIFYVVIIV